MEVKYKSIPLSSVQIQNNSINYKTFQDYLCINCGEIPLDPVMCEQCQSCYCKICYLKSLKEKCKICNKKTLTKQGYNYFTLFFKQTSISCIHKNCPITTTYDRISSHINDCGFERINCLCGDTYYKNDKAAHMQECPQRKISCEYCGLALTYFLVNSHIQTCPDRLINCKGCNIKIKYKDTKNHSNECKNTQLECPKCNMVYSKNSSEGHDCSLSILIAMKQENDKRLSQLENQFKVLVENIDKRLSGFDNRIGNIEKHLVNLTDLENHKFTILSEKLDKITNGKGILVDKNDKIDKNMKPVTVTKQIENKNTIIEESQHKNKNGIKSTTTMDLMSYDNNYEINEKKNFTLNFNVTHQDSSQDEDQLLEKDQNNNKLDDKTNKTVKIKEYKDHSFHKWVGMNSSVYLNKEGGHHTSTLENPFQKVDSLSVQIINLSNPNYLCIGVLNYPIEEKKAWLGFNYDKNSWGVYASGLIAEQGKYYKAVREKGEEYGIGDVVTIKINGTTITFLINGKFIDYNYTLPQLKSGKYYLGVSTMLKGDSVKIIRD